MNRKAEDEIENWKDMLVLTRLQQSNQAGKKSLPVTYSSSPRAGSALTWHFWGNQLNHLWGFCLITAIIHLHCTFNKCIQSWLPYTGSAPFVIVLGQIYSWVEEPLNNTHELQGTCQYKSWLRTSNYKLFSAWKSIIVYISGYWHYTI